MKTVTEKPTRGRTWAVRPDQIDPGYWFISLKGGQVAPVLRGGMADIAMREFGGTITSVQPSSLRPQPLYRDNI